MKDGLSSFLWSGYFFDYRSTHVEIDTSGVSKERYADAAREDLVAIGTDLFRQAISASYTPRTQHLVPLSGGLDSRAILAGLLEHTEAKNVHTYTFGTPHTRDYDIGNYVASKLGTSHTSFDLTKHIFNQEELEDVSRRVNQQTILFHHAPVWEVDKRFRAFSNWSGFLGDPLAGSHLLETPSQSVSDAKIRFIERNRYVRSVDLTAHGSNLAGMLEGEYMPKEDLTLDEQLDFRNRQLKFVAPHVLMHGYSYNLPFLHRPWVDFILSVDNRFRRKQSLYKDILLRAFPEAFSYQTKSNRGLPLGASAPRILALKAIDRVRHAFGLLDRSVNYLDFDRQIRDKPDLKEIVTSNVLDLHKRGLVDWIDVTDILSKHLRGEANHADALLALASLEVHLKSGKVL